MNVCYENVCMYSFISSCSWDDQCLHCGRSPPLPMGRGQSLGKSQVLLQTPKYQKRLWGAQQDAEVMGQAAWGGYFHAYQHHGKSLGEQKYLASKMCCASSQRSKNKTKMWD